MGKREYIEKAKNLILNRVRFHAPILFDDEIDVALLRANGIDEKLPIFKFEKSLNKKLLKAFELAKKEEDFNLVICGTDEDGHNIWCSRQLGKMHNTTMLGQFCGKRLLEMVNKLNINFSSSSNFNLVYKDKFFSVNDTCLNPTFQDFTLSHEAVFDDVLVDYKEFLLNGENIYAKFLNKADVERRLKLEFNIPLEKGYYYFKKIGNSILIENLQTKEIWYFNFVGLGAKFSFSNVDGLENSVYSCINIKMNLTLKPKQMKYIFFNFGKDRFAVKNRTEVDKLKEFSTREVKKVFDVQVKTKNPKFDYYFNRTLPQRIWVNWLNGKSEPELEQKYIAYRRLFVKGKEKISFVNFSEIGLKELGVFNGEYYKKILFVDGNQKFLRVGKTYFYNICDVTKKTLQSKEPVTLSFGS